MKIRYKLMLASAVIGLALSPLVQAQTVLVAGWGFDEVPTPIRTIAATYADDYVGGLLDGAGASVRGTFHADGLGGSENLTALGVYTATATPQTTDPAILSRPVGPISSKFGYLNAVDSAVGISAATANSPQLFSFQVNSLGVDSLVMNLNLAKSLANNIVIDWFYQVGAGPVVDAIVPNSDLSALTAGSYSPFSVDFSGISALNNQSEIYLIGAISATTNTQLRLDNVGVYGSLSPIPEPSTYAALMGVAALAIAGIRRRRQLA